MIRKLAITNYILIDALEMQLHPGLNIVTGETGAGKSIWMGALELLTGERADLKALHHKDQKCVIEGWFALPENRLQDLLTEADIEPEEETIIRREIWPTGKSRAFVNDTPVTLEVLKKIGLRLIDIHGQHDTLLLANAENQLETFDILADAVEAKAIYAVAYQHWKKAAKKVADLKKRLEEDNAAQSFKQFVFNELEEAALKPGEQQALEKEQDLLKNAEDIKTRLNHTLALLDGETDLASALKTAATNLEKLKEFSEDFAMLTDRLRSMWLEIKDITEEVRSAETRMHHDQDRVVAVDERLSLLYGLQKKHRKSSDEELIALKNTLAGELETFANLDDEIAREERAQIAYEAEMLEKGLVLRQLRISKAEAVADGLVRLVGEMGMPKARFEVVIADAEPSADGIDKVRFLFSANPGLAPAELKNTASGGEFSRLMLAFKCLLARKTEMPTLIFDEIDTGISGEVAARGGKLMKDLATRHQVISITHSAQMASQADAHWFVYKKQGDDLTFTDVRLLNPTEKLEEIAKMISGATVSEAALQAAKELMES